MTSIGQENLEMVMIDFFGLVRRGDFDAAEALLDPDVTWQGLREDWVCHGPEAVMQTFRRGLERRREVEGEPLERQIFNIFTLREGRIIRIDDYRRRSEAFAAAGVADDAGWR